MREPIRWLDDPQTPESLRELLGAGAPMPAMPEQAHAQVAAFAAGLAANTMVTEAAAAGVGAKSAAAFLGLGGTGKAVVLATLMGALGTSSYLVARHYVTTRVASPQPVVASVPQSRPAQVAGQPVASALQIEPAANSAQVALPREEPSVARRPSVVGSSEGVMPASNDSAGLRSTAAFGELGIADEARLLERARAALGSNPARALEIAADHQRLYPSGQLSAEREVIVVDALLRLGRRAEAEQRAAPRLRDYPDSLYAKRLRQLLGTGAERSPRAP